MEEAVPVFCLEKLSLKAVKLMPQGLSPLKPELEHSAPTSLRHALPLKIYFFFLLFLKCVCARALVCARDCRCPGRPEALDCPGAGVAGVTNACHPGQVLCKSSACPRAPSHRDTHRSASLRCALSFTLGGFLREAQLMERLPSAHKAVS